MTSITYACGHSGEYPPGVVDPTDSSFIAHMQSSPCFDCWWKASGAPDEDAAFSALQSESRYAVERIAHARGITLPAWE